MIPKISLKEFVVTREDGSKEVGRISFPKPETSMVFKAGRSMEALDRAELRKAG